MAMELQNLRNRFDLKLKTDLDTVFVSAHNIKNYYQIEKCCTHKIWEPDLRNEKTRGVIRGGVNGELPCPPLPPKVWTQINKMEWNWKKEGICKNLTYFPSFLSCSKWVECKGKNVPKVTHFPSLCSSDSSRHIGYFRDGHFVIVIVHLKSNLSLFLGTKKEFKAKAFNIDLRFTAC